jgi:hypothetical protein
MWVKEKRGLPDGSGGNRSPYGWYCGNKNETNKIEPFEAITMLRPKTNELRHDIPC